MLQAPRLMLTADLSVHAQLVHEALYVEWLNNPPGDCTRCTSTAPMTQEDPELVQGWAANEWRRQDSNTGHLAQSRCLYLTMTLDMATSRD